MKKILYFAAACAALVACSKQVSEQPVAFEKGQEVTLSIAAPDRTKMSSELSGTDINFKWEQDDAIKVTVGSSSATFTVSELYNGGLSASFKGVMPAGGETFDVQFPVEDPVIATQSYSSSEALSHNAMKFTATGCSIAYPEIKVSAANAALRLNLYGTAQTISKIVVKDASSNSYTLNIDPAVTLPETAEQAQAFFVVVPTGSYIFSAEVYDNAATPALTGIFQPANAQTFAANKILSMPAREVTDDLTGTRGTLNGQEYVLIRAKYDDKNNSYLKWATQNLAVTTSGQAKWKTTNYQIGDYFQWAASYEGYGITNDADKKPENLVIYTSFTNTCAGGASDSFTFKNGKKFYYTSFPYYNGTSYTKYTGTSGDGKTVLELTDDVANIVLGSTWRMPTGNEVDKISEFSAMREVTYWAWDNTDKGYYVFKPGLGTSGAANGRGNIGTTDDKTKALLFFPAAGIGYDNSLSNAGSNGYYWSSRKLGEGSANAWCLVFQSTNVDPCYPNERPYGFSVRPVSE